MTPRLVLITDPRYDDDTIVRVADAVCSAVKGACVQMRRGSPELAVRLRKVTGIFMVNRDLRLAREVGADGVHVDVSDIPTAGFPLVSAPAHSDEEVRRAAGASFVLVSPIFASPGKETPRGVHAIRSALQMTHLMTPSVGVVALGGVNQSNASACFEAGADGVACIRALFEATDPAAAARAIARPSR